MAKQQYAVNYAATGTPDIYPVHDPNAKGKTFAYCKIEIVDILKREIKERQKEIKRVRDLREPDL